MALVSNFTQSTEDLLGQSSSIKSSLFSTKRSLSKINKVLEKRTKIRSTIFRNRQVTNARKIEAQNRKQQKEAYEGAKLSIRPPGRPMSTLTGTGKGFLGRIMDFITSLSIGWILTNLPYWVKLGEAFLKRVSKIFASLSGFIQATAGFVQTFASTLGNVIVQISQFNFSEIPGELSSGISKLENQFKLMEDQFQQGIDLFNKPLIDESEIGVGETAAPTPQEQSGASVSPGSAGTGSAGTGASYSSQGGEKIVDPGGKDYGYYRAGVRGSRGSTRRHGVQGEQGHTGEDYQMPIGRPLTMIAKGTVVDVGLGYNGGYGNFVAIQLDSGEYVKLAHLDSVNVKKGDKVGAGTGPNGSAKVVGFSGDTGLSTGPHLHFDYARSYDKASAAVSGTMNPAGFINGGGLVIGKNVKSTGEVIQAKTSSTPATVASPTPQQTLMGQPAPSGGTLSTAQLVSLAKQVGLTKKVNVSGYSGPLDVLMGAVAMQESRGKSTSMRSDTEVYGLWQIRWPSHATNLRKIGITSPQQLYDPLTNAKAAKMVYDRSGITAWSGFTDGKYKNFLPEAQKAAGISPGQFIATQQQQQGVPGSITPSNEGEVVFAEFPASGASVTGGYGGGGSMGSSGGSSGGIAPSPQKLESELLNTFIKNRLLVELSYL